MPLKKGCKRAENAGRKKGTMNKSTRDVIMIRDMILEHITLDNDKFRAMLDNLMESKPDAFINFVAKILPKEVKIDIPQFEKTPLAEAIEKIRRNK